MTDLISDDLFSIHVFSYAYVAGPVPPLLDLSIGRKVLPAFVRFHRACECNDLDARKIGRSTFSDIARTRNKKGKTGEQTKTNRNQDNSRLAQNRVLNCSIYRGSYVCLVEDELRFPQKHCATADAEPRHALSFAGEGIVALRLTSLDASVEARGADHHDPNNLEIEVSRLYDELRASLHRWLLSRSVPPQEAEEIVQETFLRLYRHLCSGGGNENLRGWIFQVAHNLSLTLWKGRSRLIELSPEAWDTLGQSTADNLLSPEDAILRKERLRRVYERFASLTPLQRDCVNLRLEGFRYREISGILDISTSTVSSSLRNAIVRLVKEYA